MVCYVGLSVSKRLLVVVSSFMPIDKLLQSKVSQINSNQKY